MYDVRDWWLGIAKTLWIGDMVRLPHPSDKTARPSVIIHNDDDKYRAYCHRRNQGDVVFKQHVIPRTAPEGSEQDSIPNDMQPLPSTTLEVQTAVETFLISKGVPSKLIPDGVLHYSDNRKRLVFKLNANTILGRDLTETSLCKWVDYTPHREGLVAVGNGSSLVLVEDSLSMYKVAWAMPDLTVTALLGTKIHAAHQLKAMEMARVIVMLDGDQAGRRGTTKVLRELRALGIPTISAVTMPDGKDPKDLSIQTIRDLINGLSTC